MVERFVFIRHGSYDKEGLDPRDRVDAPINDRGWEGAMAAGELLVAWGIEPDLVVTTRTRRTWETAQVVLMAADLEAPVVTVEGGFAVGKSSLEEKLADWASVTSAKTVVFVGHCKNQQYLKKYEDFPKTEAKARAAVAVYERNELGGWTLVASAPGV